MRSYRPWISIICLRWSHAGPAKIEIELLCTSGQTSTTSRRISEPPKRGFNDARSPRIVRTSRSRIRSRQLLALVQQFNQLCDERRAKICARMCLDQPTVTANGHVGQIGYSHTPEESSLRADPSKYHKRSCVSCNGGWRELGCHGTQFWLGKNALMFACIAKPATWPTAVAQTMLRRIPEHAHPSNDYTDRLDISF